MKPDPEYLIMAILTIALVILLVAQSCQQGNVSDSYGINIKTNGPAKAYTLQAGE